MTALEALAVLYAAVSLFCIGWSWGVQGKPRDSFEIFGLLLASLMWPYAAYLSMRKR